MAKSALGRLIDTGPGTKGAMPKHFYLNGDLHRRLYVAKGRDKLVAWNFPKGEMRTYSYVAIRKNMEPAFSTKQASQMVNRGYDRMRHIMMEGGVKLPQRAYTLDERRSPGRYWWSKEDILALHELLLHTHRGKPRADHQITPSKVPNRLEIRALMDKREMTYVKNKHGEFVPTWEAEIF